MIPEAEQATIAIYDNYFDGVDPQIITAAHIAQTSSGVLMRFVDHNPHNLGWEQWLEEEYPNVPSNLGRLCTQEFGPNPYPPLRLVA